MMYKDLLVRKLSHPEDITDHIEDAGLQNKVIHDEEFTARYLNLKFIHDLQKGTVKHCLHNVMTPVSAVSGYLDLLRQRLEDGNGDEKLERYSRKISEGLHEVGFLLEQLHDMYKTESRDNESEELPDVNLNWFADEVAEIINSSFDLKANKAVCKPKPKPVYIQANLFQIKLIIYNMVIAADKFATENSRIEIETRLTEPENSLPKESGARRQARLTVRCTGEFVRNTEFIDTFFKNQLISTMDDTQDSGISNGLLISCRMAEQIGGSIKLTPAGDGSPLFTFTAPPAKIQDFF